jgi:Uma2 family endonuclease
VAVSRTVIWEFANMSAPPLTEVQAPQTPAVESTLARRSHVIIEGRACIPGWVDDLESFRRWAYSDEFPERGQFSYLNGEIWVDLSMEELFSHNQVKGAFTFTILGVLEQTPSGRFVLDRMLLSNKATNLSTEPDGLFFFWETLKSGRLRLIEGAAKGYMELGGSPDMILEIISRSSVRKDTEKLRELYWRAGITEYWLVDARGSSPRFDILRHTKDGYVATEPEDGWLFSTVFGHAFQLTQQTDPLGHPLYKVQARAVARADAKS